MVLATRQMEVSSTVEKSRRRLHSKDVQLVKMFNLVLFQRDPAGLIKIRSCVSKLSSRLKKRRSKVLK